jgi:hypothetical protein
MNKFYRIAHIASYLIASIIGALLAFQIVYVICKYVL